MARLLTIAIVLALALFGGVAGVGVALGLDGDSPPADLPAEDPDLFWQDLTPEERADMLAEYPPEDGVTTPGLSEQELDAYLEQYGTYPPEAPPEAGIFDSDVLAGAGEPFQAVNYWREVRPSGTTQYAILTTFVGYERTTPEHGAVLVSASVTWPEGSGASAEERSLYPAPPDFGPLRVVSVTGHVLSLALADDPAESVILFFDVDSRSFSR